MRHLCWKHLHRHHRHRRRHLPRPLHRRHRRQRPLRQRRPRPLCWRTPSTSLLRPIIALEVQGCHYHCHCCHHCHCHCHCCHCHCHWFKGFRERGWGEAWGRGTKNKLPLPTTQTCTLQMPLAVHTPDTLEELSRRQGRRPRVRECPHLNKPYLPYL